MCVAQEVMGAGGADDISPRGSKEEGGGDKTSPSAAPEPLDEVDRTLAGVVQVVAHELLSPRSSKTLRKLADECLKVRNACCCAGYCQIVS